MMTLSLSWNFVFKSFPLLFFNWEVYWNDSNLIIHKKCLHLDQRVYERMNKTTLRLFCTAYNIFASANIASIKVEYFDRLWVKENKYLNKQKSLFHNPLVGLGVTAWKVQHKIYRTIIITRSQPAPLMQIFNQSCEPGGQTRDMDGSCAILRKLMEH